jgi:NAD(P)-dependent dehydrogenase (short-subunit alcohol dehydrogenase family)
VPQPAPNETESRLRHKGIYLITGGLGGIGLALAEHLAETVDARLVLVGRTGLPPRSEWAGMLEGQAGDEGLGRRIKAVQALEARGTEVLVVQADVADAMQMQAAVRQAVARFGTVHGVFHTAGVPGVGIIQLKTAAAAASVLAPKVQGTLHLAQALRDLPLDFMVLFSSITSATGGGPGQIDYCAANAFLDAYARYRNATAGPTIAISWGEWLWDAWSAGLQGYDETRRALLVQNRQMYGIGFAEGMDALRRVLTCELPHVFVSTQDLAGIVEMTQQAFAAANQPDRSSQTLHPRPELATSYAAPGSPLEEQLAAIWSSMLGIEQVGTNDNFFDLGGNSLLGIELINRIRKALNLEKLQTYILYDAPTVSALATHIGQSRQEPVAVQAFKDRADKRLKNLKQFKRHP